MDGIAHVDVEERACHGSNEDAKAGYAKLTTPGLCKNREHVLDMPMRSARALEKKST
jgi:hypothetical protein